MCACVFMNSKSENFGATLGWESSWYRSSASVRKSVLHHQNHKYALIVIPHGRTCVRMHVRMSDSLDHFTLPNFMKYNNMQE